MSAVEVPLSKGYVAVIDEEDADLVFACTWHAFVRPRAIYAKGRSGGAQTYMHRLIAGAVPGDGMQVDHIDHDGLNNRRSNLRLVTPGENNARRNPARVRGVTGVAGLVPTPHGRCAAQVTVSGKTAHVGVGRTAVEAARLRNDFIVERGLPHSLSDLDAARAYDLRVTA